MLSRNERKRKETELESKNLYEVTRTFFGITEKVFISNTFKIYAGTKEADALDRGLDEKFDTLFKKPLLMKLEHEGLAQIYDTLFINEGDYNKLLQDAVFDFVSKKEINPSDYDYKIFINVSDEVYIELLKNKLIETSLIDEGRFNKFMGLHITTEFSSLVEDKVLIAAIPLNEISSSDYIPRYIADILKK